MKQLLDTNLSLQISLEKDDELVKRYLPKGNGVSGGTKNLANL